MAETSTPDPTEIVAAFIAEEVGHESPGMTKQAKELLSCLTDLGWRIIRTEFADAWDGPEGYSGDRSGVFYEDETLPQGARPLYRITEEWAGE